MSVLPCNELISSFQICNFHIITIPQKLLSGEKFFCFLISQHVTSDKVVIQGLENGKWKVLASQTPTVTAKPLPARSELLNLELESTGYEKLKVTLTPLPHLPKWHPNAGSKGWAFVDEVIFNE